MKNFTILFVLCFTLKMSMAQDEELNNFPAQVTFVYPLGSHGISSQDYSYNFSLNILAGRTGGIDGVEIGGLVNLNDQNVKGAQFAGIGNICGGPGEAAQFSGIFNLVNNEYQGFQAAGIVNGNKGFTDAVQFAGITNVSLGLKGAQFAGITNVSGSHVQGFQAAGIANVSGGSTDGAQVAGIANVTAAYVDGAQVAGISNVAAEYVDGAQIAGIANVAEEVIGAQVAGIANIGGYVDGVQLAGILNVCDSIDGVPIALISIVKHNGYRRFEVWGNETFYTNASFKIGIRSFYSILSLGYRPNETYNIAYGIGFGSNIPISAKQSIDIEGHLYQVTKDMKHDGYNGVTTIRAHYVHSFGNHFSIYAGPAFNILNAKNETVANDIAPSWDIHLRKDLRAWLGFNVGMRF